MGKDKNIGRSKGNLKPSSSEAAAAFLEQNLGGLALTGNSALHRLSGFIPIDQDPEAANLQPDIRLQLRLLEKKDVTTKHKALASLTELFQQHDQTTLVSILPYWVRLFCRLSRDSDKRVREQLHRVHSVMAQKCGKHLKPFLREMLPSWVLSQNDAHEVVALSAQQSFQSTFPGDRQTAALLFAWPEILQVIRDRLAACPSPPSSTTTASETSSATIRCPTEEEEFRIRQACASVRTLSSSLELLSKTTSSSSLSASSSSSSQSQQQITAVYESIQTLLEEKTFWRHCAVLCPLKEGGKHLPSDWLAYIAAHCHLLTQVCTHLPHLLHHNGYPAVQMTALSLGCVSSTSLILIGDLWPAILCVLGQPAADFNAWKLLSFKKVFLPQLLALLNEGCGGHLSARVIAPNLLPLCSFLPLPHCFDMQPAGDFGTLRSILLHFHKSVQKECCTNETGAILVEAFMECVRYFLMQALLTSQEVEVEVAQTLLTQWLLPLWTQALLPEDTVPAVSDAIHRQITALLEALFNRPSPAAQCLVEEMTNYFTSQLKSQSHQTGFCARLLHFLTIFVHWTAESHTKLGIAASSASTSMERMLWMQKLQQVMEVVLNDNNSTGILLPYLLLCNALPSSSTTNTTTTESGSPESSEFVSTILLKSIHIVEMEDWTLNRETLSLISSVLCDFIQRLPRSTVEAFIGTFVSALVQQQGNDALLTFLQRLLPNFMHQLPVDIGQSLLQALDSPVRSTVTAYFHTVLTNTTPAASEEDVNKLENWLHAIYNNTPASTGSAQQEQQQQHPLQYILDNCVEAALEALPKRIHRLGVANNSTGSLMLCDAWLTIVEALLPTHALYPPCVLLLNQLYFHHLAHWLTSTANKPLEIEEIFHKLRANIPQVLSVVEMLNAVLTALPNCTTMNSLQAVCSAGLALLALSKSSFTTEGVLQQCALAVDAQVVEMQPNLLACLAYGDAGVVPFDLFLSPKCMQAALNLLYFVTFLCGAAEASSSEEEEEEKKATSSALRQTFHLEGGNAAALWVHFVTFSTVLDNYAGHYFADCSASIAQVCQFTALQCIAPHREAILHHLVNNNNTNPTSVSRFICSKLLPTKFCDWTPAWQKLASTVPDRWITCSNEEFEDIVHILLPCAAIVRLPLLDALNASLMTTTTGSDDVTLGQKVRTFRLVEAAVRSDAAQYYPLFHRLMCNLQTWASDLFYNSEDNLLQPDCVLTTQCLLSCFYLTLRDLEQYAAQAIDSLLCLLTTLTSGLFSGGGGGTTEATMASSSSWFQLVHYVLKVLAAPLDRHLRERASHLNDNSCLLEWNEFFAEHIFSILLAEFYSQSGDERGSCAATATTTLSKLNGTSSPQAVLYQADLCNALVHCPAGFILQHFHSQHPLCLPDDPCLQVVSLPCCSALNRLLPICCPSGGTMPTFGVQLSALALLQPVLQHLAEEWRKATDKNDTLHTPLAVLQCLQAIPFNLTGSSAGSASSSSSALSSELWTLPSHVDTPTALGPLLGYVMTCDAVLTLLHSLDPALRAKVLKGDKDNDLRQCILTALPILHSLLLSCKSTRHLPLESWLEIIDNNNDAAAAAIDDATKKQQHKFLTAISTYDVLATLRQQQPGAPSQHWLYVASLLAWQAALKAYVCVPQLLRQWWLTLNRSASQRVSKYVEHCISPKLIQSELTNITSKADSARNIQDLTLKCNLALRQVKVELLVTDEHSIELEINFSAKYPLEPVNIEGVRRLKVSQAQWRTWMLQITTYLNNQNGGIWWGIVTWRDNIKRRMDGADECPICYCVLYWADLSLPRVQCKTCRKRFHNACIDQWFKNSPRPTCPLCRELFR